MTPSTATPAYDLNFPERKAQRAYEDFISFVGVGAWTTFAWDIRCSLSQSVSH